MKTKCEGCKQLKRELRQVEGYWHGESQRARNIVKAIHKALDKVGAPKVGSKAAKKKWPMNFAYLAYWKRLALLVEKIKQEKKPTTRQFGRIN